MKAVPPLPPAAVSAALRPRPLDRVARVAPACVISSPAGPIPVVVGSLTGLTVLYLVGTTLGNPNTWENSWEGFPNQVDNEAFAAEVAAH